MYDDGGKDGKYSDNCNATLVLTAPTGYILQLSGIISTQGNNTDMLTVYENNEASGTKLLDAVTGDNIFGNPVNINPVTSTSQSMTLYFVSDNTMSMLCEGFDLTVTLVPSVGGDEIPEAPKCATPTISLVNGEIIFGCETEGAEFVSEVTVSDAKAYYDNKVSAPKKFKVKVHATKSGYNDSDEVTEEFDFSDDTSRSGDVDGNGLVNVADHVELSKIILNQQESE